MNIEPANTTRSRERLIPNPKLKLREQFHEVMRFKHFSQRTEEAYWSWVMRFLRFHRVAPHPASGHLLPRAEKEIWRHPKDLPVSAVSGLKTMVLCWFHPFLPSEMAFFELGKSISRKGKSFSLEGLLHSR